MGDFIAEHKKWIAVATAAVIAAVVLIWRFSSSGNAQEGTAYVETVENLTGLNASLGMINRFAGVIEPQGTWSVSKNGEVEIKEVFVSEGDEVEEGQVLFEYDTSKYEEDLQQAEIDLERLNNEYTSTEEAIAQLEKEKREASSSEQANYTIQIKEQNLGLKDKELDIQMKEAEIEKLESNIGNSEVRSGISGVVKSINDGGNSESEGSDSFITVMKVGNYRVKGTVNEQNIGELYEGANVLVHSRVNDRVWNGTISKIDTENAISSENSYYIGGSDSSKSSKYPFYVELNSSDGLIMGQHVYVELDLGQNDETVADGIWIGSYLVDQSDPEHPFVWMDKGGKLQKQEVTIGEVMEEVGKVKITDGLTLQDSICIPDGTQSPGMKTAPMSEKPDESVESSDEYSEESVDPDGGNSDAEVIEEEVVGEEGFVVEDNFVEEPVGGQ